MNTAAIEKFSVWARTALREGVILRAERYRLFGDDAPAADELIEVAGRAITEAERTQRAALLRRVRETGRDAFVEQMAAFWFNRLVAIRYMETHDFLPSRTRIFSDAEGRPRSQALAEAASLDLPGLDRAQVLELKAAGTDEPLFRRILLAQCAQLAEAMPRVFSALDAADALMLPDNLLAPGSVCRRLVEDLPDEEWESVKILGWAYQYYNTELRAAYQDKKVGELELGPATQVYTPDWMVRYMVDNAVGRVWLKSHPDSNIRGILKFYVAPVQEEQGLTNLSSPEELTVCDPACGSGHILEYAFDVLYEIYQECGYSQREIPSLIIEKNLFGFDIDPRAVQYAELTLTMKALSKDRRFFRRGSIAHVIACTSFSFNSDEKEYCVSKGISKVLLDELEHFGEVGTLLLPSSESISRLTSVVDSMGDADLLLMGLKAKLSRAISLLSTLTGSFVAVVANPPYRNSGKMDVWLAQWEDADEKLDREVRMGGPHVRQGAGGAVPPRQGGWHDDRGGGRVRGGPAPHRGAMGGRPAAALLHREGHGR